MSSCLVVNYFPFPPQQIWLTFSGGAGFTVRLVQPPRLLEAGYGSLLSWKLDRCFSSRLQYLSTLPSSAQLSSAQPKSSLHYSTPLHSTNSAMLQIPRHRRILSYNPLPDEPPSSKRDEKPCLIPPITTYIASELLRHWMRKPDMYICINTVYAPHHAQDNAPLPFSSIGTMSPSLLLLLLLITKIPYLAGER